MTGRLGVRHAALGVSDLPRALDFYTETLGFEPAYVTSGDWAMVSMAGTTLSLIPVPGYVAPRILGGSHPAHLGIVLATAADVDAWHQRLQFTDVPAIEAPKAHRDGSYGFYLTDPDGNPLECIFIPYRLQGTARPGPTDEAIILFAPDDRAISTAQALVGGLQRHAPDVAVGLVGLAPGQPDLTAVASQLLAHGGVRRIRIVPVALALGEGNAAEVSARLDAARAACPEVTFSLSGAIGRHPLVQEAMVGAIVDLLDAGR